jgi:isohexenylglutaconyl-CoA hydratase
VAEGAEALEAIETKIKAQVLKCAPGAVADTKALILALPRLDRAQTVQAAAENFAGRMLSDEAREGVASFVEKRKPRWAVDP